jgi:hypothetical protein
MPAKVDGRKRVRRGWTLPAAVVGVVIGAAGLSIAHAAGHR